MVGKAQQKELEAVGHIAFRVRKQGDRNAGTQLIFSSLFNPGLQLMELCHSNTEGGVSILVNVI